MTGNEVTARSLVNCVGTPSEKQRVLDSSFHGLQELRDALQGQLLIILLRRVCATLLEPHHHRLPERLLFK